MKENQQKFIKNFWAEANEINLNELDFDVNPYTGIVGADRYVKEIINGEFENNTWYFEKDGVPLFATYYLKGLIHALYPEYARINWEFMKDFSRNLETGEVVYNPYK